MNTINRNREKRSNKTKKDEKKWFTALTSLTDRRQQQVSEKKIFKLCLNLKTVKRKIFNW